MLFLLKRTFAGALAGVVILSALGLGLRAGLGTGPDIGISLANLLIGFGLFAALIVSDVLIHAMLTITRGDSYRRRQRELAGLFRKQTVAAMVVGAAMAGAGEELVFRGLSVAPAYLAVAAVLFGLLHHVRGLGPFALWASYQGGLLALAVFLTGFLFPVMVAHFLHDLAGFVILRGLDGYAFDRPAVPPVRPPKPLTALDKNSIKG